MEHQRTPLTDPNEIARTQKFIIRLGRTMHAYGTHSHHLEQLLNETTYLMGLNGSFLISPTAMSFVFWLDDDENQTTHTARVQPGGVDLNRLALTHDLAEQVIAGEMDLDEGVAQLEVIRNSPNVYSKPLQFLAWGFTSAGFAGICGTGFADIIAALFFGWLVYFFVLFAEKSKRIEVMLEPMSALVIGFLASALVASGVELNVGVVVLSGIIAFIPGLSLTLGLRELAARDLVSGTARIMDAVMMLFKLYFGAAFGLALGTLFWVIEPHAAEPYLPQWVINVSLVTLSATLIVIFNVRLSDAFWSLLCGIVAYLGLLLGNHLFGIELGGLIGALIVGLYANVYGRIKNTPSHIALLPGIVILVPGSKAFIGLNSMVSGQEIVTNSASSSQVFLIFMALVAGLMFANVILPPRQRILSSG
ncbi:threonine/serine exporter family protein [Leucothrix sargassi]|nr:threonine/serine exporter family protein [Leucothrix sargassi]